MFVVRVPGINGLGKTEGCQEAGKEILKNLKEIYSNEKGKIVDIKFLDLEEIHLDNSNLELTNKLIYKNSLKIFDKKPKAVFLGGDHSISYSLTKSFFDHCKNLQKEPCLIVFDAHPDCMPPINEKLKNNAKFPTHEEWIHSLIEEGFPPENILLVGARNLEQKEISFLKEKNVKIISMNQIFEDIKETGDIITEFSEGRDLYVSIDIDVIDPSFAPGTGYIEPGGLTSREFLYLIQRVAKIKNLRAIDIVEINPQKDKNELTVKLGAKILSELI